MPLSPRICAPVGKSGPLTRWMSASSSSSRVASGFSSAQSAPSDDLAQVVRRDVRGHSDRDADRTVDEQVREARGKNDGLLGLAVVVVLEVDGLLVDVPDHLHGERRHLGLGVPHGRGAVVAGRAEVALAESERIAKAPRLHESNERVVDRRVTVRVELPHHVADDAGALVEALVGTVAAVVHAVDHAAMNGLQPVAHLGQRAPDDDAHRVVEVRPLHLELQVDLLDLVVAGVDDRVLEGRFCRGRRLGSVSSAIVHFGDRACRIRCPGSERLWRSAG